MALQNLPFLQSLPTVTAQTQDDLLVQLHPDHHHRQGTGRRGRRRHAGRRRRGLVGQVIQSFHHTSRRAAGHRRAVQGRRHLRRTGSPGSSTARVRRRHDGRPGARRTPRCTRARSCSPAGSMRRPSRRASPWPRCESFHTAAGASQETIDVDPAADLSQLAYVDVVQWAPAHVSARAMVRLAWSSSSC